MKPRHIHTHNPSFPLYTPKSVCTAALTTWYNFQKRIKKEKPSRFFILFFGCCCPFIFFFEGGLFPRSLGLPADSLLDCPPPIHRPSRDNLCGVGTATWWPAPPHRQLRGVGGVGTSSKPSLFISFSIFFCWKPCFTLSRFWFEKKTNKSESVREKEINMELIVFPFRFHLCCVCVCVTFATSAVEGLHSFNAHHNQPRVTVDVHNQPDWRRWGMAAKTSMIIALKDDDRFWLFVCRAK